MNTFQSPLAYGGSAFKPVAGVAIFLPIRCLELAESGRWHVLRPCADARRHRNSANFSKNRVSSKNAGRSLPRVRLMQLSISFLPLSALAHPGRSR
ncbi:MAG: hypothetical protein WCJ69_16820 [Betaproteobacteria bacterium]